MRWSTQCHASPQRPRSASRRGALNGRSVAALARGLCVSERHLRRCLEREAGTSPLELALTHRLLLAKRLLADTTLGVTRIAYASGFQSLRRFNAVFRERYGMTPTQIRRAARNEVDGSSTNSATSTPSNGSQRAVEPESTPLRLTMAYRPPLAWDHLLRLLERQALPGVELVACGRYMRAACIDGRTGRISVAHAAKKQSLVVELSPALLPALMPVLARLRRLLDLDAEPAVVDAHLDDGALHALIHRRPGLRIPGSFDAFEVVLTAIVRDGPGFANDAAADCSECDRTLVRHIVAALGKRCDSGMPELNSLAPTAACVADAGERRLRELGLTAHRATSLARVARAMAESELHLGPGAGVVETHRALALMGVSEPAATAITMRVLGWPDAFPTFDTALQRKAGVTSAQDLERRAERWRPWRAYAALHLWADDEQRLRDHVHSRHFVLNHPPPQHTSPHPAP